MQQAEHSTQHTWRETVLKLLEYLSTFQKNVNFDFFWSIDELLKSKKALFSILTQYTVWTVIMQYAAIAMTQ